jgi:hypothetical protein
VGDEGSLSGPRNPSVGACGAPAQQTAWAARIKKIWFVPINRLADASARAESVLDGVPHLLLVDLSVVSDERDERRHPKVIAGINAALAGNSSPS